MMCIHFISTDNTIQFSVPCIDTDTFAEVEKLYKKYPEYRETNNCFLYKGKNILRFKTISENNIESGMPVTLWIPPSE